MENATQTSYPSSIKVKENFDVGEVWDYSAPWALAKEYTGWASALRRD